LQAIETGDEASLLKLLKETLLGPLHAWQRFELAVALGVARGLSTAHAQPVSLGFFGAAEPIARVGTYDVYWQSRTSPWRGYVPEPSEEVVSLLLKQYGLSEGADRPDLIVLDREAGEAVAIAEVKYFSTEESDGADALRAAVGQLVRYARGYCDFAEIDALLDHSFVALARAANGWNPAPKPSGLPLVVDFDGIVGSQLEGWARRLVRTRTPATEAVLGA
jgi:hypothetical protein